MGHSYAVVGMVVCLPIPYVPTCRGTHSTVHVGLLYMYGTYGRYATKRVT